MYISYSNETAKGCSRRNIYWKRPTLFSVVFFILFVKERSAIEEREEWLEPKKTASKGLYLFLYIPPSGFGIPT
jgi:hypothetical protein